MLLREAKIQTENWLRGVYYTVGTVETLKKEWRGNRVETKTEMKIVFLAKWLRKYFQNFILVRIFTLAEFRVYILVLMGKYRRRIAVFMLTFSNL